MSDLSNKLPHNFRLVIRDLIFVICDLLIFSSPIYAESLRSNGFKIDMGSVNIGSGSTLKSGLKPDSTVGQSSTRGQFDSVGYWIRPRFGPLNSNSAFSFTVDSSYLDFGRLLPNTFSTNSNLLSVSTGDTTGYKVVVIENQALTDNGGSDSIPDTACDPSLPCSISLASSWTSALAYGFGYSIDSTNFRPFPNNSVGQKPQTIISYSGASTKTNATVTYKLNVSPAQSTGNYHNIIQYLALPGF